MSRTRNLTWLMVVPLLLVMLAISLARLDMDGLWYDEVWSVYNAGGYPYEPLSPAGIWNRLATEDPDQGLAYPLMLATWGAVAGWSEFATRFLSLLAGCLAVAGVYGLGRDAVSPRAGLFAAVMLGTSAFFIYYTHELRVFTIVALSAVLLLWCYWRILNRPPHIRAQRAVSLQWLTDMGFVAAGIGLTYTHYFAATMLMTVGLYHVLFAPGNPLARLWRRGESIPGQNRRWWRPVLLAVIIGLLFVPWLPVFISSITRTSTRDDVHAKSLAPLPLLETLFGYFGNGPGVFALVAILAGLLYAVRLEFESRRSGDAKQGVRFLAGIAGLAVPVIVVTNLLLQIIEPGRARYLIILWVPLALLAGMGIAVMGSLTPLLPLQRERRSKNINFGIGRGNLVAWVLLGVWLINALLANFNPEFVRVFGGNPVPRWQAMTRIMTREGLPEDVFAFYAGERHYELKFSFDHAMQVVNFPVLLTRALVEEEFKADALHRLQQARRIWYGVDTREPVLEEFTALQAILDSELTLCDTFPAGDDLRFSLYARSGAFCPGGTPQMRFGTGITLTGTAPLPEIIPEKLMLPLGWTVAPDVPPDSYSVAVQILDENGTLAAQGADTGLPAGNFVTMQFDIDLSALPPGTYGIYVIVYNWRTLERLPGTRLITGENGTVLRLSEFQTAGE